MKRERFIGPYSRSSLPAWSCPNCAEGTLKLISKSLLAKETVKSLSYHSRDDWEPDWTEENYSAILKCIHCGEHVFSIGKMEVVEAYDEEHGWCLESALQPLFFQPAINIITIPDQCPNKIKQEIVIASSLFWADHSACANSIRTALELILTHKKIKKTDVIKTGNNKGKTRRLNLHERIGLFKVKNSQLADTMLAVKWLGNAGSHTSSLHTNDVLDAFELLDHVIEELFVEKLKKIRKLTKDINRKKGPTSAK